MKVVFLKKRWLLIIFAVMITFAIFYMTYMLHSVPIHQESEPFAVDLEVAKLKKKLIDLENKAIFNQHNLNKIDQLYKKLSNEKEKERIEQIEKPHKIDDELIIEDRIKPKSSLSTSTAKSTTNTFSTTTTSSSSISNNFFETEKNLTNFLNTCDWLNDEKKPADILIQDVFDKLPFDDIDGGVWKQGFDITYDKNQWTKDKKLKIIVVPHSHNDPGWLMTFEQYFQERTKYILDTIVNSLSENTFRKFVWAETSYLSLWWAQATDDMKNKMKRLILETKQLEIVTGGWVMTDEANSNYYAMIEQMIEGHEWLRANIDKSIQPVNGWSIDPFGYTPTMAYLLKQMGFQHMTIQRVHYHVKKYLAQSLRFEFKWTQSWATKNSKDTSIFCHVMPFYSYDVPHTCGPDPKICCQFDFKRLNGRISCPWGIPPQIITENNVKERANLLLDQYRKKSQLYGDKDNHNVLMVQLGDDFRYTDMEEAVAQFDNYQRLMEYMNSNPDMNVEIKFGTLSDYFQILDEHNSKTNKKVESFSGDFFTYADRNDHYWSGYFTSRPFNKRLDRLVESYLRSAEIVFSLTNLISNNKFKHSNELYKKLLTARRNLGLFQHHDGITGTSKTPVVKDYAMKLYKSIENCIEIIEKTAGYLMKNENQNKELKFLLDDISLLSNREDKSKPRTQIKFSNDKIEEEYKIVLYNSNLNKRKELVSFKINTPNVEVLNNDGTNLKNVQLSLVWPNMDGSGSLTSDVTEIRIKNSADLKHGLDFDTSFYELLFEVDLKPLSFETFTIKKLVNKESYIDRLARTTFIQENIDKNSENEVKLSIKERLSSIPNINLSEPIVFDLSDKNNMIKLKINEKYEAHFSSKSGLLNQIVSIDNNNDILKAKISIIQYGTTTASEKSGAYLFLPDGKATELASDFTQWIRVETGLLRIRVCVNMTLLLHCVEFYPTLNQAIDLKYPHFSVWNIVDLRNSHNKEIALHIDTDIKNGDTLYTDLNGFQFIKRKTLSKLPLQGNVYPMPTASFIQDESLRFNLLTAQPLGVASLEQSAIQVFLDRRLDQDDNRGMEQAMNDNILTSSRFIMFFESIQNTNKYNKQVDHPSLMLQLFSYDLLNPTLKLVLEKNNAENYDSALLPNRHFLKKYPCDLRLINLRSMQTPNEEPLPNEVGLILHRIVYDDCVQHVSQTNNICTIENKILSFEDLFNFISNKSNNNIDISHTYLTFSEKESTKIQQKEPIIKYVQPMQIEAFRVKFQN